MKRPIDVLPPRPGMADTLLIYHFARTKRHLPDLQIKKDQSPAYEPPPNNSMEPTRPAAR